MKVGNFSDKKTWRLLPATLFLPAALLLGAALLTGTVLLTGTLAACTQEMGWNSDFILTTNLKVGTAYTGESIEAGETVYYDFIAAADAAHTITVTPAATVDIGWELFTDPSYSNPGILVATNANGPGLAETAGTGVLVHATKYYIAVTEVNGTAGDFDIQITYP